MEVNDTIDWNAFDKQIEERLKQAETTEDENRILGLMVKQMLELSLDKHNPVCVTEGQ